MDGAGCWSTVVCTPAERASLGLTAQSEWLLRCRLAAGHQGNHATDATNHPRTDRRLWLEWNDFDDHAQSLIERNPCRFSNEYGMGCLFFEGHGGPHYVAPTNGHARPRPSAPPSAPIPTLPNQPRPGQPLPNHTFLNNTLPSNGLPTNGVSNNSLPSQPFPGQPQTPIHQPGPASGERHVLPRQDRQPPPWSPLTSPGRHTPSPQAPPVPSRPPVNAAPAVGHRSAAVDYSHEQVDDVVDTQLGRHVMPNTDSVRTRADDQLHAVTPSRRHRMPDAGSPPASPPAVPPPVDPPAAATPAVRPAGSRSAARSSDGDISAALSEVAIALSKLADAIRTRG